MCPAPIVCVSRDTAHFAHKNHALRVVCGTYHPTDVFSTGTKMWDLLQDGGGNRLQGFCRPLVKPVNGTAVHKRGELSQACTEDFSNRAEGKTSRKEML